MTRASQVALGINNRVRVMVWLRDHPGGTNKECAAALGMNVCVVGRHVKALRETWPKTNVVTSAELNAMLSHPDIQAAIGPKTRFA